MKRIFVMLIALTFIFSCFVPIAFGLEEYKTSDTVEFGSYPQTLVTDEKLIEKLMGYYLDWKSYGYYCTYEEEEIVGTMGKSDFSMFADVELDGEKYRAVRMTAYFPDVTFDSCPSESEWFPFETNTIYWFKYEPIEWIVLDAEEGLLFSKMILDSRPFHFKVYDGGGKYLYGNAYCSTFPEDYSESDIRVWLNGDFYSTAFTERQQKNIIKTDLVNDSRYLTGIFENRNAGLYGSAQQDSVYLLSYFDVINSEYGFNGYYDNNDPARERKGTDYSKIQGLSVHDESELSPWYTRTSGYNCMPLTVENGEIVCEDDFSTFIYGTGICPAIRVISFSTSALDDISDTSSESTALEENSDNTILTVAIATLSISTVTLIVAVIIMVTSRKKHKRRD